jgi:hypothetical protein
MVFISSEPIMDPNEAAQRKADSKWMQVKGPRRTRVGSDFQAAIPTALAAAEGVCTHLSTPTCQDLFLGLRVADSGWGRQLDLSQWKAAAGQR